jgi:hypothetical protein
MEGVAFRGPWGVRTTLSVLDAIKRSAVVGYVLYLGAAVWKRFVFVCVL